MAPPVPCRAVGRRETHRPCGLCLPALRAQHFSKSSDASSHLCLPRGPAWPPPPSPLPTRRGWGRRAAQESHGQLGVGGLGWSGTRAAAAGTSGFYFLVSMLLVSGAVVACLCIPTSQGRRCWTHLYRFSPGRTCLGPPPLCTQAPLPVHLAGAVCPCGPLWGRRALSRAGSAPLWQNFPKEGRGCDMGLDQSGGSLNSNQTQAWSPDRMLEPGEAGRAPDAPPPSGLFLLPPQTSWPSKAAGLPSRSREENLLFVQKSVASTDPGRVSLSRGPAWLFV